LSISFNRSPYCIQSSSTQKVRRDLSLLMTIDRHEHYRQPEVKDLEGASTWEQAPSGLLRDAQRADSRIIVRAFLTRRRIAASTVACPRATRETVAVLTFAYLATSLSDSVLFTMRWSDSCPDQARPQTGDLIIYRIETRQNLARCAQRSTIQDAPERTPEYVGLCFSRYAATIKHPVVPVELAIELSKFSLKNV
jgi:hypothetical protein